MGNFAAFIREAWPIVEPSMPLIDNWHIDALAVHLQAVAQGDIRFLLINIGPGYAKSVIASVMFSAWLWARNPATRIIAATYASQLTIRDSIRTRDLVTSEWFQDTFNPGWAISRQMKETERLKYMAETNTWEMVKENEDWLTNDKKGERRALSIGGKATGFRADGQIFDDLLNATDRHSKPARDDARDWAISTMSSRFNDMRNGWRVVIGQRLHEDDPYGAMLKTGRYEHLCLPSEFEPERRCVTSIGWEDPRKEAGELLFPKLFTLEVLAQAKIDLGSYDYAGQHQQRPAPAEGGIFNRNWWQYYKIGSEPQFELTVITVDAAFKDKATSDDVAIQVWSFIGPRSYLRKEVADKMGFGATKAAVKGLALEWKPAGILIEDKANGSAVIEELKKELSGVIAIEPEGGKIARAWAVQPTTEAGNIFLPDDGSAGPLVEECAVFPNGSQDNRVDAFTQVINWRRKRMFSLGLVDFLKQEQQARNEEMLNKIGATQGLAKPATGENTVKCEKCGSAAVVRLGAGFRCNGCGTQWGEQKLQPGMSAKDVRKLMEGR